MFLFLFSFCLHYACPSTIRDTDMLIAIGLFWCLLLSLLSLPYFITGTAALSRVLRAIKGRQKMRIEYLRAVWIYHEYQMTLAYFLDSDWFSSCRVSVGNSFTRSHLINGMFSKIMALPWIWQIINGQSSSHWYQIQLSALMAKVDLGRILMMSWMAFYGYYYVLELLGMICLTDIRHFKHAIVDFSNGFVLVYLKRFFIHWQQIYMNAVD